MLDHILLDAGDPGRARVGDIANVPIVRLEEFVSELLDMPHVRDIRLASKSLAALPQHFLQRDVLEGLGGWRRRRDRAESASPCTRTRTTRARSRRSSLALRTPCSTSGSATSATRPCSCGVSTRRGRPARPVPRCSTEPRSRPTTRTCATWSRTPSTGARLWERRRSRRDHGLPSRLCDSRLVCDVPLLGKMWVHQVAEYDRELGISRWRANDWAADGAADGFRVLRPDSLAARVRSGLVAR